jgi:hypothetical protein
VGIRTDTASAIFSPVVDTAFPDLLTSAQVGDDEASSFPIDLVMPNPAQGEDTPVAPAL